MSDELTDKYIIKILYGRKLLNSKSHEEYIERIEDVYDYCYQEDNIVYEKCVYMLFSMMLVMILFYYS